MSDIIETNNAESHELMNIFRDEEDRKGIDLLAMSNFFDVFIENIKETMDRDTAWEIYRTVEGFASTIAAALKSGIDISQMGMLVADYSHFSQDIIDGLKEGVYHIGMSKEVAGNLRPAILDKSEHLVKFFTLKKAINPSSILSDISTLSMQAALQRISAQIEDVDRNVDSLIDFSRREKLSNNFIYARDKIMLAATASEQDREAHLSDADTYLMEGLTDLYSDVDAQVKKLAETKGPFARIRDIDKFLTYINEDMQMIPRYVGLRLYLFNYRGNSSQAKRILGEYHYHLQTLSERVVGDGRYTAFQLIHMNYPYNHDNRDFWLKRPKIMLEAIKSYETMLDQRERDVFYIGEEGSDDEHRR